MCERIHGPARESENALVVNERRHAKIRFILTVRVRVCVSVCGFSDLLFHRNAVG